MVQLLLLVAILLTVAPVRAQTTDAIKQRAAEIQKWRTMFADAAPTVRLAALESATRGKDPSLRALAIDAALKTPDTGLQAAALLNIFAAMRTIIIEPATEAGSTLSLAITKFDPLTGAFAATGSWHQPGTNPYACGEGIKGQLSGVRVQFADQVCSGTFQFETGHQFVGQAKTHMVGAFPAHFSIQ